MYPSFAHRTWCHAGRPCLVRASGGQLCRRASPWRLFRPRSCRSVSPGRPAMRQVCERTNSVVGDIPDFFATSTARERCIMLARTIPVFANFPGRRLASSPGTGAIQSQKHGSGPFHSPRDCPRFRSMRRVMGRRIIRLRFGGPLIPNRSPGPGHAGRLSGQRRCMIRDRLENSRLGIRLGGGPYTSPAFPRYQLRAPRARGLGSATWVAARDWSAISRLGPGFLHLCSFWAR